MNIPCSGCGNPTTPRQIQKGPRGPWTAYECLSGCLKPGTNYKLTTSPPKAPAAQASNGGGEAVEILKRIDAKLTGIYNALVNKNALQEDPLENVQVDEPTPF